MGQKNSPAVKRRRECKLGFYHEAYPSMWRRVIYTRIVRFGQSTKRRKTHENAICNFHLVHDPVLPACWSLCLWSIHSDGGHTHRYLRPRRRGVPLLGSITNIVVGATRHDRSSFSINPDGSPLRFKSPNLPSSRRTPANTHNFYFLRYPTTRIVCRAPDSIRGCAHARIPDVRAGCRSAASI